MLTRNWHNMLEYEQINAITAYCENRGVKYYDVQLELVDHIADMIEHLQKANAAFSFSDALELAGKQFSDAEFKAIVKSKKHQLLARFTKLWKKEFLSYYTIPKIAITFLLIAIVIWITSKDEAIKHFETSAIYFVNIFMHSYFLYLNKKAKIIYQNKEEKMLPLLIQSSLYKKNVLMIIPILPYYVLAFYSLFEFTALPVFIYKIALYLFPLIALVMLAWRKVHVEQNILLRNQYPKAFA